MNDVGNLCTRNIYEKCFIVLLKNFFMLLSSLQYQLYWDILFILEICPQKCVVQKLHTCVN